jgi:hypothetical protein
LFGHLDPAQVPLARQLDPHELVKGLTIDAVVAMAHDRAVDIPGDHQYQRIGPLPERPFDSSRVEQSECDIQGLTETPLAS